jgi:type I restriction enzyme, S subunit
MGGEWTTKCLGECVTLQRGFDLPSQDRRPGHVPIISSSGTTDYHSESAVRGPGVVTGRYGTIGQVFFIKEDYWPLNTTLWVKDFQGNDPLFVSYLLRTIDFTSCSDKSSVPGVNRNDLHRIPVSVPPLPVQRRIADILGSLDDKIELNRRTNETLEAMARALFKSWFIDFDPVVAKSMGRQPEGMDAETAKLFPSSFVDSDIGRVPKGWRVGTVSDLVSLSRTALSPNQFPDEVFYHYSLPAFDEGRLPKAESGGTIMSNKFIVPDVCVLLSKLNPRISRVWMPVTDGQRRALCSTEFLVCLPQVGISREFLFLLFTSTEFCERFTTFVTGTSGSHQRVKPESLLSTEIVIPPEGLIEAFTSVPRPLLTAITANIEQSRELANIRDALLPRLLSGELAIPPSKVAL